MQATTTEWQSPESISSAAERFLQQHIGDSTSNTSVIAGKIDPRHRLASCSAPLQGFLRRGSQPRARTIVGIRCVGDKPWKVYVPVDVVVTESVLVAKHTLTRGQVLSADDVIVKRRDVTRLYSGFMSDPTALVGQRLKVQLLAGKILTPAMLVADNAVKRGQTVTLSVGRGEFSIRTRGVAMADGALNQRIRVQNSQSGRIVEGIVRSRELVEILVERNNKFLSPKPKGSPTGADIRLSNNDR